MRKIDALIFDVSGVLINDLPAVWLANRDAYSFYGYHMFSSIDEYKERFKLPIRIS
jgi:beta-phosphoglucomutase-like phosphatase (HAD superfamily)